MESEIIVNKPTTKLIHSNKLDRLDRELNSQEDSEDSEDSEDPVNLVEQDEPDDHDELAYLQDINNLYYKQKKKLKSINHKLKRLNSNQVKDVWYPSDFLNNYIPVLKSSQEYRYLLYLAKPIHSSYPNLILKQLYKDKVHMEYSLFYPNTLPFRLLVNKNDIPEDDINLYAMPDCDLFLFNDNLLKHTLPID